MAQVMKRLPNSSNGGAPPPFELDDECKKEVEAVVGPISSEVWSEIANSTRRFLWTASLELGADGLNKAEKVLRRIQSGFAGARKTISTPSTSDADDFAYTLLSRNLRHPFILESLDIDAEVKFRIIESVLRSVEDSCTQTMAEISSGDHTGRSPGCAWEAWIRALIAIFEGNGLLARVRKDDSEQESAFVYAIDLMQSRFDSAYRRGTQSLKALAVAIDKARRVRKV